MQISTFLTQYRHHGNTHKTDGIELESNTLPLTEAPINWIIKPKGEILLVPACFLIITFSLLLARRIGLYKITNKQSEKIHKTHDFPCLNCNFFKDEPYLKCAVHPDKVLKKEAKNCADYCPKTAKKQNIFTNNSETRLLG